MRWDYVSVDPHGHRLYVAHQDRVDVIDLRSRKPVFQLAPAPGVHGAAVAREVNRIFTSDGAANEARYARGEQGNLKLKVKPRSAKVYVDGYFVGFVDQFDGAFQKLALNTGRHKVEIKADGFETAEFDVLITASRTVTFQGELKRIQ